MKRLSVIAVAAAGMIAGAVSSIPAKAEDDPGAVHFKRCAACHLPTGAGVPGAFPPLRGQILTLAGNEDGRTYLSFVVKKGLGGAIEVDGVTYRGMMAPVVGTLKPDQLADLLNYVVGTIATEGAEADFTPFTGEEISSHLDAAKTYNQRSIVELRTKALEAAAPSADDTAGDKG